MSEALGPEAISRRRALRLGLAGVLGLMVPGVPPLVSAAEAEAVPPAFDQVDKPIPGESGTPRTAPQGEKPIVGEGTGTRRRRYRRKRPRHRTKPASTPQPASENKPK